jgi:hypothetical protein
MMRREFDEIGCRENRWITRAYVLTLNSQPSAAPYASSAARTLSARSRRLNGFDRKFTPGSSFPW